MDRPQHPVGMGPPLPGPIAWRDLRQWADHHGYGLDEFDLLLAGVEAMDSLYLAWTLKQREAEARKNAGKPPHRAH